MKTASCRNRDPRVRRGGKWEGQGGEEKIGNTTKPIPEGCGNNKFAQDENHEPEWLVTDHRGGEESKGRTVKACEPVPKLRHIAKRNLVKWTSEKESQRGKRGRPSRRYRSRRSAQGADFCQTLLLKRKKKPATKSEGKFGERGSEGRKRG